MNTTKNKNATSKQTRQALPLGFALIQDACAQYSKQRSWLWNCVCRLDDQISAIRKRAMPELRMAAATSLAEERILRELIDAHRPLFDKPRTRIFSDIKVGLQKQKGATNIEDEEKTVALIAKHFPDRLEELAPAKRTVSKTALANLTAADLKKIGVEITADTDAVLIKPQDSDVEKAVAALLKDSESGRAISGRASVPTSPNFKHAA